MNSNTLFKSSLVLALALSGLTACSDDDDAAPTLVDQTTPGSVANFLAGDPRFTVLSQVADLTGLLNTLDTSSGITVFAPTDAAFNSLPDEFLVTQNFSSAGDPDDITSSISAAGLTSLLQAHVSGQNLSSTDVAGATSIDTLLSGAPISVLMGDGVILNARAQILEADVNLQNGTVHVIDAVFVPTTQLAAAGEIDADAFPGTLFDLMEATPLYRQVLESLQGNGESGQLADLDDADTTQTVFIPATGVADASATFFDVHVLPGAETAADLTTTGFAENAAFARVSVADGAVEGVNLLATDIAASNGVLHLVAGVIPTPDQSAADLITTNRSFGTLGAVLNMIDADGVGPAVEGSDTLLDTLRSDEDTFTIFAPNNAAFDGLATLDYDTDSDPATTFVDEILAETSSTGAVLLYHVVAGTVDLTGTATTTALGEDVTIGTLGTLTVLNDLIEVIGDGTETSTMGNTTVVYELGNVLIPEVEFEVVPERPQSTFPGPTSVALAYFTAFSGFSDAAGETSLTFNATVADSMTTAPFAGTIGDIFRFVDGDPALLVDAADANFTGELIAPFAVDTDADETPDANLSIDPTTAFVPLDASLPEDVSGDVIPYHVAFGTVLSGDLMDGMMVPTLTLDENGDTGALSIDVAVDTGVTLNGSATVIFADLETTNGVIHVISEALAPPSDE